MALALPFDGQFFLPRCALCHHIRAWVRSGFHIIASLCAMNVLQSYRRLADDVRKLDLREGRGRLVRPAAVRLRDLGCAPARLAVLQVRCPHARRMSHNGRGWSGKNATAWLYRQTAYTLTLKRGSTNLNKDGMVLGRR